MKLASFDRDGVAVVAIVREDHVLALDALDPRLPLTLEKVLEGGAEAMAAIAAASHLRVVGHRLSDVRLLPPLRRPGKFLGIGMNYHSHIEEMRGKGQTIPDPSNQLWFNKQISCIVGPYDTVHLPRLSEQLDYEGELGVVIGRRCRHVTRETAPSVVAGYLVVNDFSVRDWQRRSPTATLGKSFDTHGPIGPWLTTSDEVPNPEALHIRTLVDGQIVQDGSTSEMVNGIADIIAYLSSVMTLEPGDILATGTPRGVGAGRVPPVWLRAGQTVRVEVEGLGFLENRVIDEPQSSFT